MGAEDAEQAGYAARRLAACTDLVSYVGGRWRARFAWFTGFHIGQRTGYRVDEQLEAPWQDASSWQRRGWRERRAFLAGEEVFGMDYAVCRRCAKGWIEQPYTDPEHQRCGLASAGLAALRAEYPSLEWHTLGGHLSESREFWRSVGAGIKGSYRQHRLCKHKRHHR